MRLANKVALVTGGGTGIGRGIAELFAREGAKVAVAGRRSEPLQSVVKAIRAAGSTALAVKGDVSLADQAQAMVHETVATLGGLHILVNNAGIGEDEGTVEELSEDLWDLTVDVNLKGPYLLSRAAIPEMRQAGGGSIINISSTLGLRGTRQLPAYCSSKAGLVNLTRALALDCALDRIRVNCICPGLVDTPMTEESCQRLRASGEEATVTPLGRIGRPADIAYAALYYASDESAWVTGSALAVDGGKAARG